MHQTLEILKKPYYVENHCSIGNDSAKFRSAADQRLAPPKATSFCAGASAYFGSIAKVRAENPGAPLHPGFWRWHALPRLGNCAGLWSGTYRAHRQASSPTVHLPSAGRVQNPFHLSSAGVFEQARTTSGPTCSALNISSDWTSRRRSVARSNSFGAVIGSSEQRSRTSCSAEDLK